MRQYANMPICQCANMPICRYRNVSMNIDMKTNMNGEYAVHIGRKKYRNTNSKRYLTDRISHFSFDFGAVKTLLRPPFQTLTSHFPPHRGITSHHPHQPNSPPLLFSTPFPNVSSSITLLTTPPTPSPQLATLTSNHPNSPPLPPIIPIRQLTSHPPIRHPYIPSPQLATLTSPHPPSPLLHHPL